MVEMLPKGNTRNDISLQIPYTTFHLENNVLIFVILFTFCIMNILLSFSFLPTHILAREEQFDA